MLFGFSKFFNNEKKFKLTGDTIRLSEGVILHRIEALKSFGNVKVGDLGGYVESEDNLSQSGTYYISE